MAVVQLLPAGFTIPSARSICNISGLNPLAAALPASLGPRLLSYLRIKSPVTEGPARLDTGRWAQPTREGFSPPCPLGLSRPQP